MLRALRTKKCLLALIIALVIDILCFAVFISLCSAEKGYTEKAIAYYKSTQVTNLEEEITLINGVASNYVTNYIFQYTYNDRVYEIATADKNRLSESKKQNGKLVVLIKPDNPSDAVFASTKGMIMLATIALLTSLCFVVVWRRTAFSLRQQEIENEEDNSSLCTKTDSKNNE